MPSEKKLDLTAIENLVVAGWTGRNTAALEAHIKELEALGVKRQTRNPYSPLVVMDSGFAPAARPGMTTREHVSGSTRR